MKKFVSPPEKFLCMFTHKAHFSLENAQLPVFSMWCFCLCTPYRNCVWEPKIENEVLLCMNNEMRQQILCCVHQARKNFIARKKKGKKKFHFYFIPQFSRFWSSVLAMCLLHRKSSPKISAIFTNMIEL